MSWLTQYQAVDREAIWAALFAQFQSQLSAQFASMGRKHVSPPQLSVADQPAFFQVAAREKRWTKPPGTATQLQLEGFLIVYVFDESPAEDIGQEKLLAETTLNNLLKAIDAALEPDNLATGKFTIGGLATHCWIEGNADLDPAIFGPQAAAILPIHILVP